MALIGFMRISPNRATLSPLRNFKRDLAKPFLPDQTVLIHEMKDRAPENAQSDSAPRDSDFKLSAVSSVLPKIPRQLPKIPVSQTGPRVETIENK